MTSHLDLSKLQSLLDQDEAKFQNYIEDLAKKGRPLSLSFDDKRIADYLAHQNIELSQVIEVGCEIEFLPNANLSMGATGKDITEELSNEWQEWAIALAKKMNLKLVGIDLLVKDLSDEIGEYAILEINHSPGLAHYKTLAEESKRRVENYYKSILEFLSRE